MGRHPNVFAQLFSVSQKTTVVVCFHLLTFLIVLSIFSDLPMEGSLISAPVILKTVGALTNLFKFPLVSFFWNQTASSASLAVDY